MIILSIYTHLNRSRRRRNTSKQITKKIAIDIKLITRFIVDELLLLVIALIISLYKELLQVEPMYISEPFRVKGQITGDWRASSE